MTTPSARNKTLSEQAHERLRQMIIGGALDTGQPLVEAELVARLGMSKSPIREALLQLAQEGLVVMQAGRTARVFSVNAQDVRALAELRETLEIEALRLAARQNRQALIKALRTLVDRMQPCVERRDPVTFRQLDGDFHRAIVAACENSYFLETYERLGFRIQALRNRLSEDFDMTVMAHQDHQTLIDLLASTGDTADAEALIRLHIRRTADRYLAKLDPDAAAKATDLTRETLSRVLAQLLQQSGADGQTAGALVQAALSEAQRDPTAPLLSALPDILHDLRTGTITRAPAMRLSHADAPVATLNAAGGSAILAVFHAVALLGNSPKAVLLRNAALPPGLSSIGAALAEDRQVLIATMKNEEIQYFMYGPEIQATAIKLSEATPSANGHHDIKTTHITDSLAMMVSVCLNSERQAGENNSVLVVWSAPQDQVRAAPSDSIRLTDTVLKTIEAETGRRGISFSFAGDQTTG